MKMKLILVLAAVGVACAPSEPQTATPTAAVAVFDPTTGNIPQPNDLALQPSAQVGLSPAQQQLLGVFAAKGGFPSDQDLPITISFQAQSSGGTTTDGGTSAGNTAPDLDFSSFVPGKTVFVVNTGTGVVPIDQPAAGDYVKGPTFGTLSIHHQKRTPWPAGQYIAFVRGGPNGVKTSTGQPIVASSTFFLIEQGHHLDNEADIGILRAQAGSTAGAQALAAQLNQLIDLYTQTGTFAAVQRIGGFPPSELAALTTFRIAPTHSVIAVDAARGIVPLPIDLLRDPRPAAANCAACGHLTPLAACTFAQGTIDPATGACSQAAAAAGFATLDGFSTTGLITAPVSTDLVPNLNAATITPATVQLYDLSGAAPALVDPTTYITEPAEVTAVTPGGTFSPVIALQPAGATGSDPTSVFRTKPLKENTNYAVVISNGVKDQAGNALSPSTVGSILKISAPLVDASGTSQLAGIDNATAAGLEAMRLKLAPVYTAAAAHGIPQANVVMAYTFKTQSFLTVADQLAALPYTTPAATANTAAIVPLTADAAFAKYGVPPAVPHANIGAVLETQITTFNLIDPTTGAFNPDPTKAAAEAINVLIATPAAANVPACAGPLAPFGKCSPLLVFRHGLGRARGDMLNLADTFTAQGYTVVAIDAAKHGDRSFCIPGAASQCGAGLTCVGLPAGAQADANPPGCCLPTGSTTEPASFPASCGTTPSFIFQPVGGSACGGAPTFPGCPGFTGAEGVPTTSANFLVSANFFRTRDTLRQDFIDESQLVRAIAFVPSGPPPTHHNLFDFMISQLGFIVDPANINFVGQSLGSIQGTGDVATNPRIGKAVLNVGGGTIVDIFTTSPAFGQQTLALLTSLGIQPGTAAFLQFTIVAKTVLDPADPVNFAEHLSSQTLPDLLKDPSGATPQAAKSILTQAAFCDQVVPNAWEFVLDSNAACGPAPAPLPGATPPVCTAPLPITPTFGQPGPFELFFKNTGSTPNLTACPGPAIPPVSGAGTPGAITHGFLLDFVDPSATGQAQADAVTFLKAGTQPPSLRVVP